MARDAFRDIAPLLDAACGWALDTPLGHLLGDYMMALEHHLPGVTEADLSRLARVIGAIVAVAIAPSAGRVAVAGPQIDVGRKERVRRVIRKHLRTPTFRPSILCRLVGMSRSNLYSPISIDCSRMPEVSPDTFSVNGCSKRTPC